MQDATERNAIISELYNRYQANGFITEDEALACFVAHQIPLTLIDSITDHLLSVGVIIKIDDNQDDYEEEIDDRTRTDYDAIFREVLQISPELTVLVDYIKNVKPPQRREWHLLISQAQNGNQYARDRLFDMYLRVVVKTALKYHKESGYEIDDIIQVGAMGLLRAIRAYDFSKHGSFVSYMPLWIAQYISRAISDLAQPIRIPIHMLETMSGFQAVSNRLEFSTGIAPSIGEVADEFGITYDAARQIQSFFYQFESIDDHLLEHDDGFIEYSFIDDKTLLFEETDNNLLREQLLLALGSLKPREADVLRLRVGFNDGNERTLEEVGAVYNVTRERIRQIEAKALRRLRHPSQSRKLKDFWN